MPCVEHLRPIERNKPHVRMITNVYEIWHYISLSPQVPGLHKNFKEYLSTVHDQIFSKVAPPSSPDTCSIKSGISQNSIDINVRPRRHCRVWQGLRSRKQRCRTQLSGITVLSDAPSRFLDLAHSGRPEPSLLTSAMCHERKTIRSVNKKGQARWHDDQGMETNSLRRIRTLLES